MASIGPTRSALQVGLSIQSAIFDEGILPAIRVNTIEGGMNAVEALQAANVRVCEIAMSSARSAAILQAVIRHFGDRMIFGAGTVLDPETAACCVHEGAQFIVSPTLNPATISYCRRHNFPMICGAFTPTEILTAWEAGATCVKVFPASCAGGPSFIRAIKAPLPKIDLLPMGGVSIATAGDYIRAGASALGVGQDLINGAPTFRHDIPDIVERVHSYRRQIVEARLGLQDAETSCDGTWAQDRPS